MVSTKAIRAANEAISSKSLNALFVGATSGIGLSAVEALLKSTTSSKVYIVGRSQSKFRPKIAQLQSLDASAKIIFLEAQVSRLKEVERVCGAIIAQEGSLDLLWLSQGGLSLADHALTPEGLFEDYAVTYYSRTLFMSKLLPLLNKSADGRVISVLAPGTEGALDLADPGFLDSRNYGFLKAQKQGVTMMSLVMRELATENPSVSFLHSNPGMVSTAVHEKWADTMTGAWAPLSWVMRWAIIPMMHLVSYTPEEAGHLGLYEATNERYRHGDGGNYFRLWQDGEDVGSWGQALLEKYEEEGAPRKLWEHTTAVFEKVLGSS